MSRIADSIDSHLFPIVADRDAPGRTLLFVLVVNIGWALLVAFAFVFVVASAIELAVR